MTLAERIIELVEEATAGLCSQDAFEEAGAAIALAIDVLDSPWKEHALREGIIDCLRSGDYRRRLN